MPKENDINRPSESGYFWLCAGLLVVLLVSIIGRDITRPFYGLHSWAEASGAWAARSHAEYGLGYTKGMATWAVGNPPPVDPQRYWDHPQLAVLFKAGIMVVFGINEWAPRVVGLVTTSLIFLILLKILRGLLDDKTALLAGLIYVLFPISGYFGLGSEPALISFLSVWFYLVLIGAFADGPEPKRWHKFGLGITLFMALQFSWTGFFWAFGIGVHYVARCVFRRKLPEASLLAILIVAPLTSLALTFTIMAGGYGWHIGKIVELFKWRAAKGEMQQMESFDWGAWLETFWQHAVTNFTTPVLITAILYLTLGQLFVFMQTKPQGPYNRRPRQFPQFWLFLIPPLSQLLILRGALWKHQSWEMPIGPFIAIAAASAVMLLSDILRKTSRKLAAVAVTLLLGLVTAYCLMGTNYYYDVRWQPPEKIRMFKLLNRMIPPDKALLSFEPFTVDQHESKGAFYRPEIAWYLDREIVQATLVVQNRRVMVDETVREIEQKAATGRFPYYLMLESTDTDRKLDTYLALLSSELQKRYRVAAYFPSVPGDRTRDGKFLRAGMPAYIIFNLAGRPAVQE